MTPYPTEILVNVANALQEDIQGGDITALLIPEGQQGRGVIIAREPMILCGCAWVIQSFKSVNANLVLEFFHQEGSQVGQGEVICRIEGPIRAILTAERVALNFMQLLSAVATTTRHYVDAISHTSAKILDTRKTIPSLRYAQKYAVTCGGGQNHRFGLYDAFLIKENHIKACGSISGAVSAAKTLSLNKTIEVEVETLDEFKQALAARPDVIMLDNFRVSEIEEAVNLRGDDKVRLEASGGVTRDTIAQMARTGVDYISVGDLTKSVKAIDLSLLLKECA